MNSKTGRLIVVEGVDGSGKATQTAKIYERLLKEGYKVKKVEYPRYDNSSSELVKMYLRGEFGDKAKDVNPYIASTFYAADRYASYKQDYEDFYKDGGIVIADRYTTSNMVHQAGKINDKAERNKFLNWLWDFEFKLYGLPIPDLVFFLDIPPEFNEKLMDGRKNKFSGGEKKDIHERDINHLTESYNNACQLVDMYNWIRIGCIKNDELRSIDDIHEEIYKDIISKI
jgi:dTMP kinase